MQCVPSTHGDKHRNAPKEEGCDSQQVSTHVNNAMFQILNISTNISRGGECIQYVVCDGVFW